MRKPDKTDLTDARWEIATALIPPAKPGGRPRGVDMRGVPNTLLYQARTGCRWELLPHDLLPRNTAWGYFQRWRDDGIRRRITDALRERPRRAAGRDPTPRVGYIDSRTVKGTEVGGERGHDGNKEVDGRKRPMVADSPGPPMAVVVTAASADDGAAAPRLLGRPDRGRFPRPETVRGDAKYRNHGPAAWLRRTRARSRVAVAERPAGSAGLVELPKRRVSERTSAWRGRDRRHGKDHEWRPESSEAWAHVGAIGQMLRRPAPDESHRQAPFRYKRPAAA